MESALRPARSSELPWEGFPGRGKAFPGAQACLEAGFADFATLRQDPDLAPLRGADLDKLLSRCARKVCEARP